MLLDYKLIGKNIRDMRKKVNLTQEVLAERAGLSVNHISHIEIGASQVSLPALVNICEALKTTTDRILYDNLSQPTEYLRADITECFANASPHETRVMIASALSVKQAMRTLPKER